MQRLDAGAQRSRQLGRRLEQRGHFLAALDRALPAIDRGAGREDVDARRQPLAQHGLGDAPGIGGAGEGRPQQSDVAHRRRPAACAPHVVAATSSAPTNWWSAARVMSMPLHTVAMPSRICTPKALWMAIEARRSMARTWRASEISPATATHAHQRWTKWTIAGS